MGTKRSRIAACGARRRSVLRGAAAWAVLAPLGMVPRRPARAGDLIPDSVTMLVAGPDDGRLAGWARLIAPSLSRALGQGQIVHPRMVGGADGVTAANQFDARADPDGGTVLLAPGEAGIAWLTGDPRARFDPAGWVPVMMGIVTALVMARADRIAPPRARRLRVATAGLPGPELAALLGLHLLGFEGIAVAVAGGVEAASAALGAGQVDVVLVRGPDTARQIIMLGAGGAVPLFTLDPADDGAVTTAAGQDVPSLAELALRWRGAPPDGPLFSAWRALAAAARLDFALILPALTPAATVALWRRAARAAASSGDVQTALADLGVASAADPPGTAAAGLAADPRALLEMRRWCARSRYWQPS